MASVVYPPYTKGTFSEAYTAINEGIASGGVAIGQLAAIDKVGVVGNSVCEVGELQDISKGTFLHADGQHEHMSALLPPHHNPGNKPRRHPLLSIHGITSMTGQPSASELQRLVGQGSSCILMRRLRLPTQFHASSHGGECLGTLLRQRAAGACYRAVQLLCGVWRAGLWPVCRRLCLGRGTLPEDLQQLPDASHADWAEFRSSTAPATGVPVCKVGLVRHVDGHLIPALARLRVTCSLERRTLPQQL